MAELGERTTNEFVGIVTEDMADSRSDVEESTFEGDHVEEVGRAVKDEHVKRLVTVVGIERDGFSGAVGEGDRSRRMSGGRKVKGGREGSVGQKSSEVFGQTSHGHGGGAPVACGDVSGWDRLIGIIDDVSAILELAEYGFWLFGQIDLEADVIDDVIYLIGGIVDAPAEGNDRDHVDKGGTVLTVVDDTDLALLAGDDVFAHMGDGVGGGMHALLTALHVAAWGLKEAAVAPDDLMLVIAGELEEGRRGVDCRR